MKPSERIVTILNNGKIMLPEYVDWNCVNFEEFAKAILQYLDEQAAKSQETS